jgi:hypothetical protein
MPPQQGKRLLDLGNVAFGLGTHEGVSSGKEMACGMCFVKRVVFPALS